MIEVKRFVGYLWESGVTLSRLMHGRDMSLSLSERVCHFYENR